MALFHFQRPEFFLYPTRPVLSQGPSSRLNSPEIRITTTSLTHETEQRQHEKNGLKSHRILKKIAVLKKVIKRPPTKKMSHFGHRLPFTPVLNLKRGQPVFYLCAKQDEEPRPKEQCDVVLIIIP
ncbi:hypothetical protein ACTXT7_004856 [Hymenolepis weldensis]